MNGVVDNAADLTAEWLSEMLGTDVRSVVHERIGSGVTGAAYRLALDATVAPAPSLRRSPPATRKRGTA